MRVLLLLTCVLATAACRHPRAEPAPLSQQRPIVLRYCIVPPDDAGPAMTVDEAIAGIEQRIAAHGVEGADVHEADDEIIVELPDADTEPSELTDVLRGTAPVLQPCPPP